MCGMNSVLLQESVQARARGKGPVIKRCTGDISSDTRLLKEGEVRTESHSPIWGIPNIAFCPTFVRRRAYCASRRVVPSGIDRASGRAWTDICQQKVLNFDGRNGPKVGTGISGIFLAAMAAFIVSNHD